MHNLHFFYVSYFFGILLRANLWRQDLLLARPPEPQLPPKQDPMSSDEMAVWYGRKKDFLPGRFQCTVLCCASTLHCCVCIHALAVLQEVWLDNGWVAIDGKTVHQSQIQVYRETGSTRTRSRTRGGAQVRAKDLWLQYQFSLLCKKYMR